MHALSRRNLVQLVTVGATVAVAGLPSTPAVAQTAEEIPARAIRDYTTTPIVDSAGQFILLRV